MFGRRALNDEVGRDLQHDALPGTSLVGFSAVSLATHCCNASLDFTALHSFLRFGLVLRVRVSSRVAPGSPLR